MSVIDNCVHASVTLQVSLEVSVENACARCDGARAPVLPQPCAIGAVGGIAERIAVLVMDMAITQKKSARETDAIESAGQHAAEDRQISEMRDKATSMRTAAFAEGIITVAGGALTLGSLKPGIKVETASGIRQFGMQVSNGAKVASGLGAAAQAGHDMTIEQQKVFAQRALRSSDNARGELRDAAELLTKALAFVRDAARTQADCNMASVRWG